MTEKIEEAVVNPTAAQRKDLPAGAYALPWFAGEDGKFLGSGTFQRSKSKFPHHVKAVGGDGSLSAALKASKDNDSVDLPRLRNALAILGGARGGFSTTGFPPALRDGFKGHLEAHADALLKRKGKEGAGDVRSLARCLEDLRAGYDTSRWFALGDVGGRTSEDLYWDAIFWGKTGKAKTDEAIVLMEGERLEEFQRKLSDAVRLWWKDAIGEDGYVYVEAIFDSAVVVYVRLQDLPTTFQSHPWAREASGNIVLGKPVEVRIVTSYVPVSEG